MVLDRNDLMECREYYLQIELHPELVDFPSFFG
jgi:hypothetical protein